MGPALTYKYNLKALRRRLRNNRHDAWFKALRGLCRRAWNRIGRRDARREIESALEES
jgi:hypothetical protein